MHTASEASKPLLSTFQRGQNLTFIFKIVRTYDGISGTKCGRYSNDICDAISPAVDRGTSRWLSAAVFRFSTLLSRTKVHFHLIDGGQLSMSRDIYVTHAIARILLLLSRKIPNLCSF